VVSTGGIIISISTMCMEAGMVGNITHTTEWESHTRTKQRASASGTLLQGLWKSGTNSVDMERAILIGRASRRDKFNRIEEVGGP
jgi:hypothetical protein